jgi:hypothetical protein
VEEAADQGGIDISSAVDLVPLDKLPRFVGRKVRNMYFFVCLAGQAASTTTLCGQERVMIAAPV